MQIALDGSSESNPLGKSLERQARTVVHFFRRVVYDSALKAGGSAAVGVFFRVLGMPLCWPFLGHCTGMFSMRILVNLTKEYNLEMKCLVNQYAAKAMKVHEEYPYLRVAVFVGAVVSSAFFWSVGLMLGLAVGAASALTIDLERTLKHQQMADAQNGPLSIGNFINQLI